MTRNDIIWKTYNLPYREWFFQLLKITSKNIKPQDKIILITSWIHGNEIGGPLSLLTYINKILDIIHSHWYKVIIYPLNNPSGFQLWTRYNCDSDRWSCGNNDFLRYKLSNGTIVDELSPGETYKKRYRSSDKRFNQKLPKETALLHKLLKKDPYKQIAVSIDLHQDYLWKNRWVCAYHYSFGDLLWYDPIIWELKKNITLISKKLVNSGFMFPKDILSDHQWFVIRHEGSLTDLMWRLWVKHSLAVETTGKTPLSLAKKINRLWIKGLVLLLDKDKISWVKNTLHKKSQKNISK